MTLEVNGQRVLGFDTGLDSRAFAQAKIAQFITEPGIIVRLGENGTAIESWNTCGVVEAGDDKPTMVVWGPLFSGDRLDNILNESSKDESRREALASLCRWAQAVLALGESQVIHTWPCAAMVSSDAVFFMPPVLARRCLMSSEVTRLQGGQWYAHPDLDGMEAVVFSFAAMLYRIITGNPPFCATDDVTLPQDMRESNFLPIRLAVPGLDEQLASMIHNALSRPKGIKQAGHEAPSLNDFLAVIQPGANVISLPSLISPLPDENLLVLEKEKNQFLRIQGASVNTKRFIAKNTAFLIGVLTALAVGGIFAYSMVQSRALRPTTEGMDPVQVIESYYHAFGELDHTMMEACVLRGVGRNDINMVSNLFVISRVRMAHEPGLGPAIISAQQWQELGGDPVNVQVFGVTDLQVHRLSRDIDDLDDVHEVWYRVEYILWIPAQFGDSLEDALDTPQGDFRMPLPQRHTDEVTLVRRQGNWRIAHITRVTP